MLSRSSTILVTGAAGFIGSQTSRALLQQGHQVIGVDDFNDYYSPLLKEDRVKHLLSSPGFTLYRADISEREALLPIFRKHSIDKICHLAARAGVRASLLDPSLYEKVNVGGTLNLLELAREFSIQKFVFASTSSVYGSNTKMPFSEDDRVDHPISPYSATKRAGELLCYTYHHLYKIPMVCLRFFTVYGPWGRPDMALFKFAKAIRACEPIEVYNGGAMRRDFTYVEDIVRGVLAALERPFEYEIFNLGNSNTVELNRFIECIEHELGKKAIRNLLPLQPGDVSASHADISKAKQLLDFSPKTNIEEGIHHFVEWYLSYYS